MGYSTETMREIWDDKHGDRVEVGPDRDALGMVEVRYKTEDGAIASRVAFSPEQARMVAHVMLLCADELDSTQLCSQSEGGVKFT